MVTALIRRLLAVLLLVLLAGGGVVLVSAPASVCPASTATPAQQVEAADALFTGTVSAVTRQTLAVHYTVQVERVYKGDVGEQATVMTRRNPRACGLPGLVQGGRYVFYAAEDGLVDAGGRHVRAAELPDYLREHKLDPDAFYFLWITAASAPLDTLAPAVKPLGDYGVTKVIVRARPGVTPRPSARKTLILQGKPDAASLTSADCFPDLRGRPAALRPDPLPRGIRYKFADHATVRAAAAAMESRLLTASPSAEPVFADSALLLSGAWQVLRAVDGFSPRAAQAVKNRIPLRGRTLDLESALLREGDDLAAATRALRQVVAADGGGALRALHAAEMTQWWTFIAFDIAEPVFVLETANGRHRFVLSVTRDRIVSLDELGALPAL